MARNIFRKDLRNQLQYVFLSLVMSFDLELDPPVPFRRWEYNRERLERILLKAAMKEVGENPNRIAWYLGITVPTVRTKLNHYRMRGVLKGKTK